MTQDEIIKALKDDLKKEGRLVMKLYDVSLKLSAEREQARDALKEIAAYPLYGDTNGDQMIRIARSALELLETNHEKHES